MSSFPLVASFCTLIFCCKAFTAAVICVALSAFVAPVLQYAKACVQRGLHALHHVQQLLHLRLQLDNFLRRRVRRRRRGSQNHGKQCRRRDDSKCACI